MLRNRSVLLICAIATLTACDGQTSPQLMARTTAVQTPADCSTLLASIASHGGTFVLNSRCRVSKPIVVSKPTTIIAGPSMLTSNTRRRTATGPGFDVGGKGQFIINVPGGTTASPTFTLRGLTIRWYRPNITDGNATRLFTLRSSGVLLADNTFVADVEHPVPTDRYKYSPPSWLFTLGAYPPGTLSDITLRNNQMKSETRYNVGVLVTYSSMRLENVLVTQNRVTSFHGVFYLMNCHDCEYSGNYLFRNSWGNLIASGSQLLIENNTVWFSGNGSSGDGITLGPSTDTKVMGNQIINGSCYGMAFGEATRLTIKRNLISHDITSAIYIAGVPGKTKDVVIEENFFTDNNGYGILAKKVDGLTVRSNVFRGVPSKAVLLVDNQNVSFVGNSSTDKSMQMQTQGANLVPLTWP